MEDYLALPDDGVIHSGVASRVLESRCEGVPPSTSLSVAEGAESVIEAKQIGSVNVKNAIAYVLVVLLALVWGVHWAIAKVGLSYLPPFTYGVLRVATAAVTLAVILAVQGRIKVPSRHDVPIVLVGGLGQIAAGIILMNIALQFLPAGRSALLAYTTPIWVVGLQVLVLRARPSGRELLAVALGLGGIAILLNPASIDWRASGVLAGSGMMLLSAAIMGATILHLRHHRWEGSTLDLMFWEVLVATVPLGVLAVAFESGRSVQWQLPAVLCVLYSGSLATAFAYWASQSIQRTLAPMATAISLLAVPVVGIVTGAVVLGEQISLGDLIGFAITFIGIATLSLFGNQQLQAHQTPVEH